MTSVMVQLMKHHLSVSVCICLCMSSCQSVCLSAGG